MLGRFIRGTLQLIGACTVIAAAVAVAAVFLLGPWLQYETPVQKADYILPLAGEAHRYLKAVELYKEGYAPKILLSNARVRPLSRVEEIQVKLGHPRPDPYASRTEILDYAEIPMEAREEFGNGHVSTVEEAEALRAHLGSRPATIILVTSPYHSRRAKLAFERAMPGARFLVASPPEGRLADPWWSEQDSAVLAVTESAKLAFFWLGGAFRKSQVPP